MHNSLMHQQTSFQFESLCAETADMSVIIMDQLEMFHISIKQFKRDLLSWTTAPAGEFLQTLEPLSLPPPGVHQDLVKMEEVGVVKHPSALITFNLPPVPSRHLHLDVFVAGGEEG